MTKRILYPIVFALLLLMGGWGNKASGQSSGATYAVRYTLPKGVSDLRCVTYFPPEGKVVVTSGRKIPAGEQLTFTATVEDGYEIDHWLVNGKLTQHEPEAYGGAKIMEMEMPGEDIDVVIVMKQPETASDECTVTLESSAGGRLSALYVDRNPFTQEEEEVYVDSGDAVPKNITLEVNAIAETGAKIGKWYQDDVAISGSEGSTRQSFVIRKDTKIKVDFETSAKPFEGYTVTLPNESPEGTIAAYYEDDNYNHVSLQAGENKVPKWKYVFLTATPKAGYEFSYWTFNGQRNDDLFTKLSDNSCRYEPDADVTIGAVFKQTTPAGHKITLTAGEGGTLQCSLTNGTEVQSGSTVDDGVALRFNARPMNGYKTDQWTINGEPYTRGKGKNTIIQRADKDLNVEVSFLKDIKLYTVEYIAGEGGTIAATVGTDAKAIQSNDQVEQGAVITFTATPQEGYELDQWMVNGNPAVAGADTKIEGNKLIVTLGDQDLKVEATFKKLIVTYEVTYSAGEGGDIVGATFNGRTTIPSGSKVNENDYMRFTAMPNTEQDYKVDQWIVNGEVQSQLAGRPYITWQIKAKTDVKVTFKKEQMYEVDYKPDNEWGTIEAYYYDGGRKVAVEPKAKVKEGTFVEFQATVKEGYALDAWTNNGEEIPVADIETLKASITLRANAVIDVKYHKLVVKHAVSFTAGEGGAIAATVGTEAKAIESNDQVEQGAVITFTATPQEGYELDQWMVNGKPAVAGADTKIEGNKLIVTLGDQDLKVEVTFKQTTPAGHKVTLTAGEGGTLQCFLSDGTEVQSGSTVDDGVALRFNARPMSGYKTDQWTINGEPFAKGKGRNTIIQRADKDLNVEVSFLKDIKLYTVEYVAGEGGTIAATVGAEAKAIQSKDQVEQGAVITFTATPQEGYELDQWMVNGKPAVAGADTKIEGNKLIVTLGDQDLKVEVSFKKVNAISQISEAGLAVYPNPFAERIVITIPAECIGQTAYLTSMQGEIVLQMTLDQVETVLYTDALSHGTYLLRVGSQSQLLIKE
ncbi:T9SS type A sorting domain-containing protein [uncultured Porphyromonas sp.]|uniref:InlB B-repeat-containing protein n=1 Tax=uncultured Porphyromonas sp. TaxID=159274 RepID=UPI00263299C5|nr:T9SS type A sorting domain-containing protein [uncultured Porphyromonas sp.]